LAHLPPKELAAYLKRVRFEAITPRTVKSKSRLRAEIASVKEDGFAYSREEYTPGITGIATIVADEGRVFGALNLAVPTARFTAEREAAFRRQLRSVASAIAQALHSRTSTRKTKG
jgi:DNA-binding IclR family transcriptional regulator